MRQMLNQVKEAWRTDELTKSISSFHLFCATLGMDRLPDFLSANNFRGVHDWSEQPLNNDGQAMQAAILERSQVLHPSLLDILPLTAPSTYHSASLRLFSLLLQRSCVTARPHTKLLRCYGQRQSPSFCRTFSSLLGMYDLTFWHTFTDFLLVMHKRSMTWTPIGPTFH